MTDLMDGKVGDVSYKLEFVDGKLKLSGDFLKSGMDVGLSIMLDPAIFLDQLKAVIPGSIDDAIIDAIKGALAPKA